MTLKFMIKSITFTEVLKTNNHLKYTFLANNIIKFNHLNIISESTGSFLIIYHNASPFHVNVPVFVDIHLNMLT